MPVSDEFSRAAKKLAARKGALGEADLIELSRQSGRDYVLELHGWSAEEYLEYAPENRLCEFLDGKVFVSSPASVTHQMIVQFLTRLLADYVEENDLGTCWNGPATTRVADSYLEPDLFFLRRENESFIEESRIACPPDLVVEVLSPSTRSVDLGPKLSKYMEAGVAECWFVDYSRQELMVWQKASSGYRQGTMRAGMLSSAVIPGFSLQVEWLWQRPLPRISGLRPR